MKRRTFIASSIATAALASLPFSLKAAAYSSPWITYDIDDLKNGRWMVERMKNMLFVVEQETNKVVRLTGAVRSKLRLICTADAGASLQMAGVLEYTKQDKENFILQESGPVYAGKLINDMKVYIDPDIPHRNITDFDVRFKVE